MHNTSRLSLNIPDAGDNVSTYPTVSSQQMTALDAAVTITEGTFSSRPSASSVPYGSVYYATDTGIYYLSNATAWSAMCVAGAWTTLTLSTNIVTVAGNYAPAARIVGDMVELSGTMKNNTGGTTFATMATLPSVSYSPASGATVSGNCSSTSVGATPLIISASGTTLTPAGPGVPSGSVVALDGQSYRLS